MGRASLFQQAKERAEDGFDVKTRADLEALLRIAAGLEHSLAVEYLFAGFSVKRPDTDALTDAQAEVLRRWRGTIFLVARQEMEHLGIVNNLLNAIGAAPDFHREPFPTGGDVTPEGLPLELRRLDKVSLDTFIHWEKPSWAILRQAPPHLTRHLRPGLLKGPAPDKYSLEQLYLGIRDGFEKLASNPAKEKALFTGNPRAQYVYDNPSRNMLVQGARGLDDARSLVYQILEEGEGFAFVNEQHATHFHRFCAMADEMATLGMFDPARPVVLNPTVDATRPAPSTPLSGDAAAVGRLFNLAYDSMVLALARAYQYQAGDLDPTKKTPQEQEYRIQALYNLGFQPLMTLAIRPLGEILTELPSGRGDGTVAGAPFERLHDEGVLALPRDAFLALLRKQLQDMVDQAQDLAAKGVHPRLGFVAENLALMVRKFDNELKGVPQ